MKFYSEKLNKMYSTAAEVVQAEEAYDKKLAEEKAKKEELANTRKARAEEVEKALEELEKVREKAHEDIRVAEEKARKVLADFCKDYGAFHKTYKEGEKIPAFSDWLNDWVPFWRLF